MENLTLIMADPGFTNGGKDEAPAEMGGMRGGVFPPHWGGVWV